MANKIIIDEDSGSIRRKTVNPINGDVDHHKEYRPDDDMTAEPNEMLKDAVALAKKWKTEGKLKAPVQVAAAAEPLEQPIK